MNVLDLFSGIGGFSLGLERAGMHTIGFCEIDPYCRAVLRKHWPDVPCHDDIRTFRPPSADVICAGFPCQDISLGHTWRRAEGLSGTRSGLYWEAHRIIAATKPRRALFENVVALRSRGLDTVLRSLAEIGYDAEWHCIPAAAAGAAHQRDRVWIVAHPEGERVERLWPQGFAIARPLAQPFLPLRNRHGEWQVEPDIRRTPDGFPRRMDRLRTIGNAVVPQIAEMIGREIMASA